MGFRAVKATVIVLLCFLVAGCGLRGGQYTLADLEAEYNRAQDAIAHAEQLNASQYAPRVLKLAKDRLQTIRDKQLSAPSVDVIRQFQYVQTLANRAALQSLNQQVSGVRQDLQDRPDRVQVDTESIQKRLASLETQLSNNSKSIDSLSRTNRRQTGRLEDLEDTVGQISPLRSRLNTLRDRLKETPSTRLGDTLTRLLRTVRRHDETLENLCGSVRSLKQQLVSHRNRIGKKMRGRHSGLVYPRDESGLVGYWPFEDGDDGKFSDASGNLSMGRTVGSMERTSGIFGSGAVSFRDRGSLLGVSDHPDLDPGTKDGFAVSGWFKAGSDQQSGYLFNKWNADSQNGWYLLLSPEGLQFTLRGVNTLQAVSKGNYTDKQWHHVALVYTRTDVTKNKVRLKLYVDGSLKDETTGRLRVNTDQYLAIGGSADVPNRHFTGSIDEVRIYRKSLTPRKILSLAAQPNVPVVENCDYSGEVTSPDHQTARQPKQAPERSDEKPSPEPEPRRAGDTDTGLVAHWPLDDVSNSWTADRVGNNPGRVIGPEPQPGGRVNGAMRFRGDTDRIRVATKSIFKNLQSLTITAWVKPEELATQYILTKGIPQDGKLASPYGLFITEREDVVFSVNTTEGFNQIRKVGYDSNEWMFLAGVYDGSSISLYIDGEKVSDLPIEGSLKTNDLPIFLGARYGSFGGIKGQLDDVRLYNYALSRSEINNLPGL